MSWIIIPHIILKITSLNQKYLVQTVQDIDAVLIPTEDPALFQETTKQPELAVCWTVPSDRVRTRKQLKLRYLSQAGVQKTGLLLTQVYQFQCICIGMCWCSQCTCELKRGLSSRVSSTCPLMSDLHSLSPGRAANTWRSLCLQRAGRKQAPNRPLL